jgi:hypothetical protein
VTQHAGLTPERWSRFAPDDRILMIGNEMRRAQALARQGDREGLRRAYERVLRLCDLTVTVTGRRNLRREILRWRDLIAELYARASPDARAHAEAFRALLLLAPRAAEQIPWVVEGDGAPGEA